MKRYGHLYEKVCEPHNLELALNAASKGKTDALSVRMVLRDPDTYVKKLHEILTKEEFVNGQYRVFKLTERGKERVIHALPFFPDRIVHHAIVQVCSPFWLKSFIRDTYASIPGRGIHDGVRRIKRVMPSCSGHYALKCDITKFYPSIDHGILKNILKRQVKDRRLLRLLDTIIDSAPGVPIGNYLSQYFGNIVLNPFDHWLKEEKRVRLYFRYCDDFVVIHESKEFLHDLRTEIASKLAESSLVLKHNWQVFPVDDRGIDFLGYRFWPNRTKLRKNTLRNFERRIKCKRITVNEVIRLRQHIGSFRGWLKYCDSNAIVRSRVLPVKARYNKYVKVLRLQLLRHQ